MNGIEKEIKRIHELFLLKEVERKGRVKNRYESSAEHTWSCMVLAQYFLPKIRMTVDEKKIMKMLLYHDLIEIEAGDTFVFDGDLVKEQHKKENSALSKLQKNIPQAIVPDFVKLWKEFEENISVEAKFCQAIDKLDPIVQSIFKKEDWKFYSISEQQLREVKEKYFEPFSKIKRFFEALVAFARKKKYFV